MPKFAFGAVRFQNEIYPTKKELFERLSLGQNPEALFITCSDSRIDTAMITQTEPGQLFNCRNPGNIIPPYTKHTGGTTASIELAVSALRVPHVVVCGHTECSAMNASINPEGFEDLNHVREWLTYAQAAVEVVRATTKDATVEQQSQMMIEQNVVLQLQHLRTHPGVAARLAQGDLQLHGWVYDIKTGSVSAYDTIRKCFLPVNEDYAEAVAELASQQANSSHSDQQE